MTDSPFVLLSGSAHQAFAKSLAQDLGVPLGNVELVTFSDGESHVIVHEDVAGKDVYLVQSGSAPANEHFMELLIMTHAVRAMKPRSITAVLPFFPYRRQEKLVQPGESLTFELVAQLLKAAGVERVLVMDLHKHRSTRFFDDVGLEWKELRAFERICAYFKARPLKEYVVLAPDKGGIPESERYAEALGVPLVKATKRRSQRDVVEFDAFEGEVTGKNILIIDDEINTAGTLVGIVDILKKQQAGDIYFACTHAVLSGPAIQRLVESPLKQVIVTDTIALPVEKQIEKINILSVSSVFADAIREWST